MIDPAARIRRRSNGSIDTDYYLDRGLLLRRQACSDLMRGGAGMGWVMAVATVLLLAIAVLAPRSHLNVARVDRSPTAFAPVRPAAAVVSPPRHPLLTSAASTSRGLLSYGPGPNRQQ